MAPEVIKGDEHTFALDFWSLGVITYEFLTGNLPFNDETSEKVFMKILKRDIKFPNIGREEGDMSPEAYDFINKLLTIDPKKRLGYSGIEEIKNHPFFADINWETIM
jgi:serine/threonine protein kinase